MYDYDLMFQLQLLHGAEYTMANVSRVQRLIQGPVKHLELSFLRKYFHRR